MRTRKERGHLLLLLEVGFMRTLPPRAEAWFRDPKAQRERKFMSVPVFVCGLFVSFSAGFLFAHIQQVLRSKEDS